MKKTIYGFIAALVIIGGLTSCASTQKLIVNFEVGSFRAENADFEGRQFDFSYLKSKPGYEKLEGRLQVGGEFTIYYRVQSDIFGSEKYIVTKIEGLMPIDEYDALFICH